MNRRKGRKKRLARLITLTFVIILIWFFFFHKNGTKINISDSILKTPTPTPTCNEMRYETNNSALGNAVESQLVGSHGTYAVVVKNLKTGVIYSQNQDTIFDSASLYKLWVMTVVYQDISAGKLNLNQTLSDSYSDLNKYFDIDPDEAGETQGTLTTTVNNALIQMITISDNYSALILTKQIGLKNMQDFLTQNCFTESNAGAYGKSPTTSSRDIAAFMEKLYDGKLADKSTTNAMINLLKQQKFTDKIPRYLPYEVQLTIAHKTGELDPYSHDAGIVYDPAGNYIVVVMSKSDSRDLANERIADISKTIFDFFYPDQDSGQSASSSAQ